MRHRDVRHFICCFANAFRQVEKGIGGDLQISVCAGEACVNAVFRYLPRGHFRVTVVYPEAADESSKHGFALPRNYPDNSRPNVHVNHAPVEVLESYRTSSTMTVAKAVIPGGFSAGSLSGRVQAASHGHSAAFRIRLRSRSGCQPAVVVSMAGLL